MSSRRQRSSRATNSASMRIAIAGGGGLAYILASQLSQGTHALLVLSTQPHPELENDWGVQVAVVNYHNGDELRYTLQGVELVISTISGPEQLNLIDAARRARVRHFVPSEFEGPVSQRPQVGVDDPLDRGSRDVVAALERARTYHHMQYTVFSCGVFYERFGPGGLAAYNIGSGQPGGAAEPFLVDIANAQAEVVYNNANNRNVQLSMTSVQDLARFLVAAVDMGLQNWPREYTMRGAQMNVRDLVGMCFQDTPDFNPLVHDYATLQQHIDYSQTTGDWNRWYYLVRVRAAADGRYNIRSPNLNSQVNFQPVDFRSWLDRVWGPTA